jgi:predicted nucleic acid-binding protein
MTAMMRKMKIAKDEAIARIAPWREDYTPQETNSAVFRGALDILATHNFQFRDAIVLAACSFAGADYLFSEDMQDGFTWRETVIVNPFAELPHPIIPALLQPD